MIWKGHGRGVGLLLVTSFLSGCGDGQPDSTSPTGPPEVAILSEVAESYLDEALDLMERHALRRHEIVWPAFRARTKQRARGATTARDTHPALAMSVRELHRHSAFVPDGGGGLSREYPSPEAARIDSRISYLRVPGFAGSELAGRNLVAWYHRLIEEVDFESTCGWVVDLRGNTGGSMWPMLAGVGPILGEGIAGYFIDPDSMIVTWEYDGESALYNGVALAGTTKPYRLERPDPPVAVLFDHQTASAGEAIIIAFIGRPDSRSFGRPSGGFSTGNAAYMLSDGAILVLTVSTMADRTGQAHGGILWPDVTGWSTRTEDPATDGLVKEAAGWLRLHPSCG